MESKAEVEEHLRLLPWFRYDENWPDPEQCESVWLLAQTMLTLWKACLVGNPAPRMADIYKRMSAPRIGDMVLETTTVNHRDWPERALGRLIAIEPDPLSGEIFTVESMYFSDHARTRWENASFIALPVT